MAAPLNSALLNVPIGYITPFGMPVVPPVYSM